MSPRDDEGLWRARTREQRRTGPRTKLRPDYADAVTGRVIVVDRGRYQVLLPDDVVVTCVRARELRRQQIVVGDRVDVVGDTSGEDGTLARIVRIAERATVLRRTADDTDPSERIMVANADGLVIVAALLDPVPRPGMIDRLVAAGYAAGMDVVLALTKADLVGSAEALAELRALYEPAGVDIIVLARGAQRSVTGLDELRQRIAGGSWVFVGHSGVGKSTLVNALVPGADRATGHVNEVTGRGRHTSSSAIALRMADGTWVIDTPGVRSFGLAHVTDEEIIDGFGDLAEVIAECPRGCTHADDSPDCELDEWVQGRAGDEVRAARVASLRRLLAARP